MLLQKRNHFFGSSGKRRAHFSGIEYPAFVASREPTNLNPCIWITVQPIRSEEKYPADGRYNTSLMIGHDLQRLQIAPRELASEPEELGSSSEVYRFRVQFGFGLFIK